MEYKLDVVGRGEIWEVTFTREGDAEDLQSVENFVFHAHAQLGERRHYSRWSLSGILARELDRQGLADERSVLRGMIRVYRRRFDALLAEREPHRMLKIEHLSLFQRLAGGTPLVRVEREVEDLLFAVSGLLSRFPSGSTTLEVPTADVEWTAHEPVLRGLPIHAALADFYQAYARLFRLDAPTDEALVAAARRASRFGLIALHAIWSLNASPGAPMGGDPVVAKPHSC